MELMDRRTFLELAAIGAAGVVVQSSAQATHTGSETQAFAANGTPVPDDGWKLWLDREATWQNDEIYLPDDVNLRHLVVNPPTGGWADLYSRRPDGDTLDVTLPATVEQHLWGRVDSRSYTPQEYRYAADDPVPQNGAYAGVSWWWRQMEIPAEWTGKRILLTVRGARMRAEVYCNEQLVGYSIMEELPFECDLTTAARPGGTNRLAIRITNPGGRFDWVDGTTIRWGAVNVYRSHGFGGLDRGLVLKAVPREGRIADAWVLNTPEPHTITAQIEVEGSGSGTPLVEVIEPATGRVLAHALAQPNASSGRPGSVTMSASLSCPSAALWDLATPALYALRVTLSVSHETDVRIVPFGFRWFSPEGLGTNAMFRLNGRRIKIYTAISWGFWGMNGLWPTPELAAREVTQAKRLGLNCLNFHRNVGKEDVFEMHDRMGLLRYMEPGGGKLAIGKLPSGAAANAAGLVMQPPNDAADSFSQQFMLAKCRAMVRAFRSHPSLIQYTLQNEIGADLKNPSTFTPLRVMHEEDPSRMVVLNDGFSAPPRNAPQAWYPPYSEKMLRSDQVPWADWWTNHQGAGDQWYDDFYVDPEHFTYRQPLKTALVEFGEMEGCAVADNHSLMVHQLETSQFGGNGTSYDLADHKDIIVGYERFLGRWNFRKAFPTAEYLFRSLGNKCYESWQQYLENVRICDAVDFAAISGWESTSIENHSGIVDNLRNFKGDPDLISSSLQPVRLVAKQHHLCYGVGESAVFDLYLLNDTGVPVAGQMHFEMVGPEGRLTKLGSWPAPVSVPDQFSYLVHAGFTTPALQREGIYKFRFLCDATPRSTVTREIWVADAKPRLSRKIKVAVSGLLPSVANQLAGLRDLEVTEFADGIQYDVIIASGIVRDSNLHRQIGDETGLEAQPAKDGPAPAKVSGELPQAVLAAVSAGTPLLAMVPDDDLADGIARQLAAKGAFVYNGQVGNIRAPWMGNWLFVREHPTFAGLPVDRALSVHYQAHGKQANGLLIERATGSADPEVVMGYSRDHDRNVGAASFLCEVNGTRVLVHRAPEFSVPLQMRWLANSIAVLTNATLVFDRA